ncbi:MAG: hypothetical protein AAF789_03720 [Bacteroidota bacterium]
MRCKSIFLFVCMGFGTYLGTAQLIEDSKSKLKSATVERRGFLFFGGKKKAKRSTGIPSSNKNVRDFAPSASPFRLLGARGVSPRFSSPSVKSTRYGTPSPRISGGRQGTTIVRSSPRYSTPNPFRGRTYKTSIRTSDGSPFRFRDKVAYPRYSAGSPFKSIQFNPSVRYSKASPFRGKEYSRNVRFSKGAPSRSADFKTNAIRYSKGSPFSGKSYDTQVRYSKSNPFRNAQYKVSPRYSDPNPFRNAEYKVTPRYSVSNPFRNARYKIQPRYSLGSPFRAKDYDIKPRYSLGNPFRGVDFKVQPRYSQARPFDGTMYRVNPRFTKPNNRFVVSEKWKKMTRFYTEGMDWKGDYKIRTRNIANRTSMSGYNVAMKFSDPQIRKAFRQWSIFWTRLNRNKLDPKGVKEKVKEPKFDRQERVIWND